MSAPSIPVGMVDTPCPPDAPPSPAVIAIVQAVLTPGPIDPKIAASYSGPEALAARAKIDAAQRERDWPNLCKYRAKNAEFLWAGRPDVVFMGDSMTELWQANDPALFSGGVVGRGISGQTTPQMLLRFYADVVSLHPKVVHILGGGNDIAGNTGPTTPQDYKNNITAMVDLAQANGIKVVLGSITPASAYSWKPQVKPGPWITELNAWLVQFAKARKVTFVDYYSVLVDQNGGFRSDLSNEGVHANSAGYALMRPRLEAALAENGVKLPKASAAASTSGESAFTLDTPIAQIAADPAGKAVLDKDLPGLTSHPMYAMFKGRSLRQVQPMSGGMIKDENLAKTEADLAVLNGGR